MFYLVAEHIETRTERILKADTDVKKINRAKRREYPGYRKPRTIQSKTL